MNDDDVVLADVKANDAIVRKRVRAVCERYTPAFFLWGPGGQGKSHAIIEELNAFCGKGNWAKYNSNITARGLFDTLQDEPDAIHFLEDMEHLLKDKKAQGVIRSACSATRGTVREVTWTTQRRSGGSERFIFTGGIIVASNEPIENYGSLGAIASRFAPMEWRLSERQLVAMMRSIASKGYRHAKGNLSPSEAGEVAEYLVAELEQPRKETKVDLRTLVDHAFPVYLQWRDDPSGTHWTDVVASMIAGEAKQERRAERTAREMQIAAELYDAHPKRADMLPHWVEQTGLTITAMDRRVADAKKAGLIKTAKVPMPRKTDKVHRRKPTKKPRAKRG